MLVKRGFPIVNVYGSIQAIEICRSEPEPKIVKKERDKKKDSSIKKKSKYLGI